MQTDATIPNIVGATMLGIVACLLAVVCKRMQQLPTMHWVCKRTQHVTSNNVGSCWPTMLRPFARGLKDVTSKCCLVSGVCEWMWTNLKNWMLFSYHILYNPFFRTISRKCTRGICSVCLGWSVYSMHRAFDNTSDIEKENDLNLYW